MSGPKLSSAEIERRRREQLERERQERLRRLEEELKIARNNYQKVCDKVDLLKTQYNQLINSLPKELADEAQTAYTRIISKLPAVLSSSGITTQTYIQATQQLNEYLDLITRELNVAFRNYGDRIKNAQNFNQLKHVMDSVLSDDVKMQKQADVFQIDFDCKYDEKILKERMEQIMEYLLQLQQQNEDEDIREYANLARKRIKTYANSDDVMKNEAMIRSFLQKTVNETQDMLAEKEKREELYIKYMALLTITDEYPDTPPEKYSLEELQQAIDELNKIYKKQDEMDYIADQINDAMVSLGYDFVSSKVLRRKDDTETDFSLYRADEKTGIAIYTDQSGAVMMRMTVLGDDPDITEEDRCFSLQRQLDFCAGHPDIVEALEKRGVKLKQKNYQIPDKKHTYKIASKTSGKSSTLDQDKKCNLKNKKRKRVDRRKRRIERNIKLREMR